MRTHRFGKSFLLFFSAIFIMSAVPAIAEEEGTESSLTQGQAAVILARKFMRPRFELNPTVAGAFQCLNAIGVEPSDGWDADEILTSGDLARLIVQLLELEGSLSPEQIAGGDPTPYVQLLDEKYGLNVKLLLSSAALNNAGLGQNGIGSSGKDSRSDPLGKSVELDDNNLQSTPVSQKDVDTALALLLAIQSGSSLTPFQP